MKELKRSQGCFGLLNHSGKRLLLVHGQISQNLTIDFNIRLLQASDQTAVRQAVCTGASVDTGNPQSAESALTVATVTVCVLTSLDNRLLGNAEHTTTSAVVTLGLLENLLVTTTCYHATLYTSHTLILLPLLSKERFARLDQHAVMRLIDATSDLAMSLVPRSCRLRFGLFLVRMWLVKDCLCLKPVAVFLNRLVAPLLVFIFGIFKTPHSIMNKNNCAPERQIPRRCGGPVLGSGSLLLAGSHNHGHLPAFHFRPHLNRCKFFNVGFDPG